MLNQVESTEYSQATTVVYTHEYPITLPMDGTGQLSRLNARCLTLLVHTLTVVLPTITLWYPLPHTS